ncbi:MAG: hypothetical protein ACM31D_05225 [Bacteroidota bacterium]
MKKDHLSFADVVAQAVGTIAPSGSPAFVIPAVFISAGNATWLAYLFATLALVVLSLNINVFSKRSASPGALYAFAGQGLGPVWGAISGWALVIAYLFTGGAVISGSVNYALVVLGLSWCHSFRRGARRGLSGRSTPRRPDKQFARLMDLAAGRRRPTGLRDGWPRPGRSPARTRRRCPAGCDFSRLPTRRRGAAAGAGPG